MSEQKSGSNFPGLGEDGALRHARSHIMQFLQGLFARRPPNHYFWSRDEQQSEITITSEVPVQIEVFSQRPALVLARGPVQFMHLGLDDFDQYDSRTGTTTKTALLTGSFTLYACSRVLLESEALAYFCCSEILSRRDELQGQGGFFDVGQTSGVGAPSQAGSIIADDKGDGVIATAVSIPFTLPWVSRLTKLNKPVLKAVDASIEVAASAPPKSIPVLSPQAPLHPPNIGAPAGHPKTTWVRYQITGSGASRRLPMQKQPVAPWVPPKPVIVRFGV